MLTKTAPRDILGPLRGSSHSFHSPFLLLRRKDKEREIDKEPKIRKNLVLAPQLQGLLNEGKATNPKQAANWLNMSHVRIDQTMNMLLLSPCIQEEILSLDNAKLDLIPEYKLCKVTSEPDWQKQQEIWQELLESPKQ